MQFCTSNKLSFTAIGELLKLLALLCPHPNLLPNSFYTFKKFFQQFHAIHSHHEVCVQCQKDTEDICSCTDINQENKAHLVHFKERNILSIGKPRNYGISFCFRPSSQYATQLRDAATRHIAQHAQYDNL